MRTTKYKNIYNMKISNRSYLGALFLLLMSCAVSNVQAQIQNANTYLDSIKNELNKKWPVNRTVNLVFHGHSVPAGYFKDGVVNTFSSYPFITLEKLKEHYPYAVVNSIVTAIGGEQSEKGSVRFKDQVLVHQPDVLFIDYALNDRSIGLKRAKVAWEKMIEEATAYGVKIILLTPTPDLRENILDDKAELAQHSEQISALAKKYHVGLIDSYARFKEIAKDHDIADYMSQNNHVNEKGHEVVATEILKFFYEDN